MDERDRRQRERAGYRRASTHTRTPCWQRGKCSLLSNLSSLHYLLDASTNHRVSFFHQLSLSDPSAKKDELHATRDGHRISVVWLVVKWNVHRNYFPCFSSFAESTRSNHVTRPLLKPHLRSLSLLVLALVYSTDRGRMGWMRGRGRVCMCVGSASSHCVAATSRVCTVQKAP